MHRYASLIILAAIIASLAGVIEYDRVYTVTGAFSVVDRAENEEYRLPGSLAPLGVAYLPPNAFINREVGEHGEVHVVTLDKMLVSCVECPFIVEQPLVHNILRIPYKAIAFPEGFMSVNSSVASVLAQMYALDNSINVILWRINYFEDLELKSDLDAVIMLTSSGTVSNVKSLYCSYTYLLVRGDYQADYPLAYTCMLQPSSIRGAGGYRPVNISLPGLGQINLTPTTSPTTPQGLLMLSAFLALFLALSQMMGWRLALTLTGVTMSLYAVAARLEPLFIGGIVAVVGGLLLYYLAGRG